MRSGVAREKQCIKCGRVKPHTEFALQRRKPDGLQDWCRSCYWEYYHQRVAAAAVRGVRA